MAESRKRHGDELSSSLKKQRAEDGSPRSTEIDRVQQIKDRIKSLSSGSGTSELLARVAEKKARIKEQLNRVNEGQRGEIRPPSSRNTDSRAVPESSSRTSTAVPDPGYGNIPPSPSAPGLGLNIPVHPLLLQQTGTSSFSSKQPTKPKKNFRSVNGSKEPVNPYFDPSSNASSSERRHRPLVFNPQGIFIEKAEELRRQARLEALKKRIEQSSRAAGLDADINANEKAFRTSAPPALEWWDEPLLKSKSYDDISNPDNLRIDTPDSVITEYIQHPIPIQAPFEKYLVREPHLHFTKREIKRIRKNERAERHKQTQDRIRLGLDPAPPPKVKLSNLMSVLTNEAIKDPTQVEMRVKREIAERKLQHEQANQERKLTDEQRHEKLMEKFQQEKDTKGIFCSVFKIRHLFDPKHRYKVNVVAQQKALTGITIMYKGFSLVIVEGGFNSVKYYQNLMMRRINWTEKAPIRMTDESSPQGDNPNISENTSDNGPEDISGNKCDMIWAGQIKKNNFRRWTTHTVETEEEARELLARNDSENFWLEARSLE